MTDDAPLFWGECSGCGSPLVHADAALLRPVLCPACNEVREETVLALIVERVERALRKLGFRVAAGVVRRERGALLHLRRRLLEGMALPNEFRRPMTTTMEDSAMPDPRNPSPMHLTWHLGAPTPDPLEYGRCLVGAAALASLPGLRVVADVAGDVTLEFDEPGAAGPIEALARGCETLSGVLASVNFAVPTILTVSLNQ